jgi:hypothetical protein
MNHELERTWEETAIAKLEVLACHLSEGCKETAGKIINVPA